MKRFSASISFLNAVFCLSTSYVVWRLTVTKTSRTCQVRLVCNLWTVPGQLEGWVGNGLRLAGWTYPGTQRDGWHLSWLKSSTRSEQPTSRIYRFQNWDYSIRSNSFTPPPPAPLLSNFMLSPWKTQFRLGPTKILFSLFSSEQYALLSWEGIYGKINAMVYISLWVSQSCVPWALDIQNCCTIKKETKKRNSQLVCQNSNKQEQLGCCKELRAPALQKLQADSQTMVSFFQYHCLRWKYAVREHFKKIQ